VARLFLFGSGLLAFDRRSIRVRPLSVGPARLRSGLPTMPFMNRVGLVFVLLIVLAVVVSLACCHAPASNRIRTDDVSFRTSSGFNIGAVIVIAILVVLYTVFW
jgi:solute:Na+ symporter, SSS family